MVREIETYTGGIVMVTTNEQAQHTPNFSAKVPDGYLECRDCGQVLDIEAWLSVPCQPRQEG